MRRRAQIMLGMVGVLVAGGCKAPTRMAARVTEVPRVDLDLEGGNRGYLIGTPPPPGALETTRQMVETTVEIPSLYKPKRTNAPVNLEAMGAPETERMAEDKSQAPGHYDTYVVQKGESLWSIAAKPEIYGKATRWRRIFDANRDLLKSPDRVRPGMTLKIPRGEEHGGSTTYGDEGTTYKK